MVKDILAHVFPLGFHDVWRVGEDKVKLAAGEGGRVGENVRLEEDRPSTPLRDRRFGSAQRPAKNLAGSYSKGFFGNINSIDRGRWDLHGQCPGDAPGAGAKIEDPDRGGAPYQLNRLRAKYFRLRPRNQDIGSDPETTAHEFRISQNILQRLAARKPVQIF